MNTPNTRHDWDGIRAGSTLKWIEQSGPAYADMTVKIVAKSQECSAVLFEGDELIYGHRDMSIASWFILQEASLNDEVTLKIRCDDVALRRMK